MAEFTWFTRVEPRPRENNFAGSLAAELRDPLWFLARQWQMGEFKGDDTGSVAFIEYAGSSSRMPRWLKNGTELAVDDRAPLERQTLLEPFEPDLGLRVELGQEFSDLLRDEVGNDAATQTLLTAFLALPRFKLKEPQDEAFNPVDPATRRFLTVCGRRSLDGYELYLLARDVAAGTGSIPPEVTTDATALGQIGNALDELLLRTSAVFGEIGTADPATWKADRLEYQLQVIAADPSGNGNATLDAHPDSDGEYEWFSFDVASKNTGASEAPPQQITDAIVPNRVQFDGMPAPRFWNFEDNTLALPDVTALSDDLLKIVATDFMLVHSHDWYTFPFEQEVGTLVKTDRVVVHDVFGKLTVVSRADQGTTSAGTNRWTMFSITDGSVAPDNLSNYFVLPPSSGPAMQLGAVLEDVRFGRDEMANMAWGIENVTTSPIGEQRSGRERNAEIDALRPPPTTPPVVNDFPLHYEIESEVPVNWIPLLPFQPADNNPSIELQKGGALKDIGNGPAVVPALSSILNPDGVQSYRIKEEEVPRSGLRVERVVYRTRWFDGSTHLWVQRRRKIGAGESQSGLQFDQAIVK